MRVELNGRAPAFQAGHVGSIPITRSILHFAGVAEQADAGDLKSPDRKIVPVRFRSSAPNIILDCHAVVAELADALL